MLFEPGVMGGMGMPEPCRGESLFGRESMFYDITKNFFEDGWKHGTMSTLIRFEGNEFFPWRLCIGEEGTEVSFSRHIRPMFGIGRVFEYDYRVLSGQMKDPEEHEMLFINYIF